MTKKSTGNSFQRSRRQNNKAQEGTEVDQTNLKDQRSIKFLREYESPEVIDRQIESQKGNILPRGCVVIPMVVLEKPEKLKAPSTQPENREQRTESSQQ